MNEVPVVDTIVKRFLHYAFEDIGYKYEHLTEQEKSFCTEEEFKKLVKWLKS
jgi:hypothetical protein